MVHHLVQPGLHRITCPRHEPLWPGMHSGEKKNKSLTSYHLYLVHTLASASSVLSFLSLFLGFCRMSMTVGVSSIRSSTLQASWTSTSIRKRLCAAWCTAATAPSSSSSYHGPPCTIRSEMMAKTSPTISPSLYWHRRVCLLWWTYRWGIQLLSPEASQYTKVAGL